MQTRQNEEQLLSEINPEEQLLSYSPSRPDQPEHFVLTGKCLYEE
jgi:hypothetical protein